MRAILFRLVFALLCLIAGLEIAIAQPTDELDMPAPVVLHVRVGEVLRTLERAAWVAEREPSVRPNGKVLYAITFRSCPTCAAFRAAEYERLLKAGVEVRWILYARRDREGHERSKPGERAMVAALWKDRDPKLLAEWLAAEDLDAYYARSSAPLVEQDPVRMGLLAKSRDFVDRLTGLLDANRLDLAIPTLIWREGAKTKVYIGYDSQGFSAGRAYLTGN